MGLITSLFTVGSSTGRAWCRPLPHRTNCVAVTGGNSCCVCIPSTATCFIIEMWGQGGGGAGSCCCMGACWGGQGGDYGWVRCTTTGTNHILCACACNCTCCTPGAGLYTGSPGQLTRTCNCTTGINYQMAPQACGGSTCCWLMFLASSGCSNLEYNTWHSNIAINCCWYGLSVNSWCTDGASYEGPGNGCRDWWGKVNLPFRQIQGTAATGDSCTCCQNFNFYVRGGCGWTSPMTWTTYSGPGNVSCGFNQPTRSYCGNGWGRGGTAYAGGAGQCCDCSGQSQPQFGGVSGNFPGGGGSSASGTGCTGGCCLGSCGGPGLVLISWS